MRISLLLCFLTSSFSFGSDSDSLVTLPGSEPSTITQVFRTLFKVKVFHCYRHDPYKRFYARKNNRPYPTGTKRWLRVIIQDEK